MSSLNRVMLIGRLGKDPEIQHFDSGVVKASFSLATSEVYINKDGQRIEQTEWHNVVMWRKLAEIAEKYLHKGKMVYIEGRLKTRSWDDKDNVKRYVTEVDATNMIMLGSGGSEGGGNYQGGGGGYEKSGGGSGSGGGNYDRNLRGGSNNSSSHDDMPVDMGDADDLPF